MAAAANGSAANPADGAGADGAHFQSHYIPNTPGEQAEMLAALGLASVDELFSDIPAEFRHPPLRLPAPLSELEIQQELGALAARNRPLSSGPSFLGAGAYHHFIPAVVKALMTRGEFLTAYTPYQAEASQGTLQVIYEFQTLIANLFGMEVANAGMYDGATSLAEGALMACRVTGRSRVAVMDTVSPAYREVIGAYCRPQGIEVAVVPAASVHPSTSSGRTDAATSTETAGRAAATPVHPAAANPVHPELVEGWGLPEEAACLVMQYPDFYGRIGDLGGLTAAAHAVGALAVVSCDPVAVGMFRPPGHYDADIVTGEGQPLGIPPSFGGPYLGLFSCKQQYIRQMPSRLAGRTTDRNGETGYVLTLQTREQHIRRERATSNICTNEALYALACTIYLSALGRAGLQQVAELCYQKAHYAAARIAQIPGYALAPGYAVSGDRDRVFFQEFIIQGPAAPAEINRRLLERNILGGLDVSYRWPNGMLLCVTEMNTRDDIEALIAALAEIGAAMNQEAR